MYEGKHHRKKFQPIVFVCYVVFFGLVAVLSLDFFANRVQIAEKTRQLEAAELILAEQVADNEELQAIIASGDEEMIERVARDQYNYAMPNERIFVDVAGK